MESAKMLATVLHGLQGTPYIYEGEELGMTNTEYPIEDYRDIELLNFYHERICEGFGVEEVMKSIYAKGRDNARTPMQWSSQPQAGFTEAGVEPWIRVNLNYREINAEEERQNPDSVVYTRENAEATLIVMANFHEKEREFPIKDIIGDGEIPVHNYREICDDKLRPYEALMVLKKK